MNLPKLALMLILSFIAFGVALSELQILFKKEYLPLFVLLFLFICQLSLSMITDKSETAFKLYGTPGRNTGFLTYLAFVLILLSTAIVTDKKHLKNVSISLVFVGCLLSIYGILQSQGIEFFDYTGAGTSVSFGTFGNVNFQSAFLGITASLTFSIFLFSDLKLPIRAFLFASVLSMLIGIYLSSAQGFFCFIAGTLVSTIIWLVVKGFKKVSIALISASSTAAILVGLGFFNFGPLSRFVFNPAIEVRGYYWDAARRIMLDNPLFGVGMDSYGDYYRRSRSSQALNYSATLISDTAHNIPLDVGAGGGVFLLVLYLGLMVMVVISMVSVSQRCLEFDPFFAAISGAWFAYQAQSLISINQIGLGIWGWTLSGLIIGYELNTRDKSPNLQTKPHGKIVMKKEQIPASALLFAVVAGAIGLAVSLPPYLAANKYYKALQSGDGNLLYESAYLKPYDRTRFLYTAQIMQENKLEDRAIQVLSDASKVYPDSFEVWQQWSQIPSATPEQVLKAKAEMKRLDPFDPDLK